MREACGGGGARLRLAHPLQLKIILSSSSGRVSAANAKRNEIVPGKITFLPSENTHEYEFHEQRRKSARQSHFILTTLDTPFRGVLIIRVFIYLPKDKIADKIGELLCGKATRIMVRKNSQICVKIKEF